jgi:hypothetical protein
VRVVRNRLHPGSQQIRRQNLSHEGSAFFLSKGMDGMMHSFDEWGTLSLVER